MKKKDLKDYYVRLPLAPWLTWKDRAKAKLALLFSSIIK
jgi:hypothetical protein